MATTEAPTLMSIPLELRHNIFEVAAAREKGPKKVLRHWFEKKEVAKLIADQAANDPTAVTPQPVYGDEYEEPGDSDEAEAEDQDGEGDSEDEDQDGEGQDGEDEDEQEAQDNEDEMDEAQGIEDEDENMDEAQEAEHDGENMEEDGSEPADGEDDNVAVDEDGNTVTATQTAPPPPRAPVVRPHRKWRHIPKFLRISQCPPPPELFLTCKELNHEAKNWFYDVAVIRIDATGSFAHTSMFEESLDQIVDAAFSPFENIRKVNVKFVWDSIWLRAERDMEPPFQAMLCLRATKVVEVLERAPELKEVVVEWHDSVNDAQSECTKENILEGFFNLTANIKPEEHYLKPGQEPHAKSIVGKKRLEFQAIVDGGCNLN